MESRRSPRRDTDGNPISHLSSRMRPALADWNSDGIPDLLVGDSSGEVRLYTGMPEPASLVLMGLGGAMLLPRRRRA